jgi:hypothetical protein
MDIRSMDKQTGNREAELREAEKAWRPIGIPVSKCTLMGTVDEDGKFVPVDPGIPLSDYLDKNIARLQHYPARYGCKRL